MMPVQRTSNSKFRLPDNPCCDLHCHSTASDGELTPLQIYQRACSVGVDLLAITDHDTTAGIDGLLAEPAIAAGAGPAVIRGIEFSTLWRNLTIHIVALGCRPDSAADAGAALLERTRIERAGTIARRVGGERSGELLAGAWRASGGNTPGRPHFARAMVELGLVDSEETAFRRYLGNGKPGDVRKSWPPLTEVVEWIAASDGVAVLAHPEAYGLTRSKLGRLIDDFAVAGGDALEMAPPSAPGDIERYLHTACRSRSLAASCGSDFHNDRQGWRRLGVVPAIPADLEPVWERLAMRMDASDRIRA